MADRETTDYFAQKEREQMRRILELMVANNGEWKPDCEWPELEH